MSGIITILEWNGTFCPASENGSTLLQSEEIQVQPDTIELFQMCVTDTFEIVVFLLLYHRLSNMMEDTTELTTNLKQIRRACMELRLKVLQAKASLAEDACSTSHSRANTVRNATGQHCFTREG